MRFPLSWLLQFLHTQADPHSIAEALTTAGIEVETVDDPARDLADLTVARILAAKPHPNADHLKLCQVETVDGDRAVVCGAPNARAGLQVIYAPPGARLPGLGTPLDRKPRRIRGVESNGMLCSERELAIGQDHDGIVEIAAHHPAGTPAATALDLDDPVFEIEVTPNRGDLLGVVGIARDLSATGIGTFCDTPVPATGEKFSCPVHIDIQAREMCPAFAGRLIRGVANCPSPDWLQRRLRAVGSTPRNMLVDVTNYLSLERARPLHVYDANALTGNTIMARAGRRGEKCATLDDNIYTVDERDCVIADASGAIGLGGVMGGLSTAVSDTTTDVFVESAWFDPVTIALTGRRHRIDSEARRRFERGVDPHSLIEGIERATDMIVKVCGGQASRIVMAGEPPHGGGQIAFRPADVERLTGVTVSADRMRDIAGALGITCGTGNDDDALWSVSAPSWRPDLTQSADIVEEIIRIEGFDHITPVASRVAPLPASPSRTAIGRRCLASRGFTEAVTWSFMEQAKAALFVDRLSPSRKLVNPVAGLDYMRPTIVASLVEAAQRNINRGHLDVRLFEAGPVYPAQAEQQQCITAIVSPSSPRHWSGQPPEYDVFALKADLYAVLSELGLDPGGLTLQQAPGFWHPGRSATACLGPHRIADFGQIHPDILDALDVETTMLAMEITLSAMPPQRTGKKLWNARALTPVVRDFAFEVSDDTPAGAIVRAVENSDKNLIARVHVFDVYRGRGIDPANKSVAVEVVIEPQKATLDDAAIDALGQKIVANVGKRTGARLRS